MTTKRAETHYYVFICKDCGHVFKGCRNPTGLCTRCRDRQYRKRYNERQKGR